MLDHAPLHPTTRRSAKAGRGLLPPQGRAQRLVAVAGGGQPPKGIVLRLGGGLLVEVFVELAGVDREFQSPWRQQDRGGEQTEKQSCDRHPAKPVKALSVHALERERG